MHFNQLNYSSKNTSEVVYTSDENFIVRLKAMIDKALINADVHMPSEFFEQFDKAEDYLFDFKGTVEPNYISPEPQQTVYPIWVKASERLPDIYDPSSFHFELDLRRVNGEFISDEVFEYYNPATCTYKHLEKEEFHRLRWLDEGKV